MAVWLHPKQDRLTLACNREGHAWAAACLSSRRCDCIAVEQQCSHILPMLLQPASVAFGQPCSASTAMMLKPKQDRLALACHPEGRDWAAASRSSRRCTCIAAERRCPRCVWAKASGGTALYCRVSAGGVQALYKLVIFCLPQAACSQAQAWGCSMPRRPDSDQALLPATCPACLHYIQMPVTCSSQRFVCCRPPEAEPRTPDSLNGVSLQQRTPARTPITPDVRLYHRAVVVAQEATGAPPLVAACKDWQADAACPPELTQALRSSV